MTAPEASEPSFRRFRRLRRTAGLRRLVRETRLAVDDFIYPLFVTYGRGVRRAVPSMPGVHQLSIDQLPAEVEDLRRHGIGAVLLFGIPETKDAWASGAYDEHGVVQEAVRAIKAVDRELVVITDVCNCEYTDHGHCGVLIDGEVANDPTLELLARTAVSHAAAGADAVAPSDMMDGRVWAIRRALDAAGFTQTPIISYAAKYASAFYGPFRDAAESTPRFGDRRSHQMDPGNRREALAEVVTDIEEGADAVIVKPALPYLDVLAAVRARVEVPVLAYHVSGEYSMVKAAALNGWIDERQVVLETLTAIKRAGATAVITYYAKEAAQWLADEAGAARAAAVATPGD
ncbi:MAG: porphobilinogen synthase [Sphaerobacter sp.]|nr:porphobilinogen synthase [Sphaerobacter sp.]